MQPLTSFTERSLTRLLERLIHINTEGTCCADYTNARFTKRLD